MDKYTQQEIKNLTSLIKKASRWEGKMSGLRTVERLLAELMCEHDNCFDGVTAVNVKSNFSLMFFNWGQLPNNGDQYA